MQDNILRFYNRDGEMKVLTGYYPLKNMLLVVYGRRRTGKTRLIEESLNKNNKSYIKFLLPEDKISGPIIQDWLSKLSERGYVPKLDSLYEIIKFVLENKKDHVLFIDEFQNIVKLASNILTLLQDYVDKDAGKIILSGSYVGMMKKIFKNKKSPLFNRADLMLNLKPLNIKYTFQIINDLGFKDIENKVKIYSIFWGIPYYYKLLKKLNERKVFEIVKKLFIYPPTNSLLKEAHNVLINEFGNKYRVYFSILEAIARGKTSLREISDFVKIKQTTLMKYIIDLQKEYEILTRLIPITIKKPQKYKEGVYSIKDPLFKFWFRYIYPNETYFDSELYDYIWDKIRQDINSFFGEGFELAITELIKENIFNFPVKFTKIGKQWGKIPKEFKPEKGKNTYEIDMVALEEKTKQILFIECKWQNKVSVEKVLQELKEKAKFVNWNKEKRKEYYAIFAKSFKKKIKEPNLRLFDLKDLENYLKK